MRTVVLDDELAALLEQEQPLDQAARETIVMDLFRRGKVSAGKACELLSLERMDFVRRAGELGVPVYHRRGVGAGEGHDRLMAQVVADSSSLIHLQKIGQLALLPVVRQLQVEDLGVVVAEVADQEEAPGDVR